MAKFEARRVRVQSLFIRLYKHPSLSKSAWFLALKEESLECVWRVSLERE